MSLVSSRVDMTTQTSKRGSAGCNHVRFFRHNTNVTLTTVLLMDRAEPLVENVIWVSTCSVAAIKNLEEVYTGQMPVEFRDYRRRDWRYRIPGVSRAFNGDGDQLRTEMKANIDWPDGSLTWSGGDKPELGTGMPELYRIIVWRQGPLRDWHICGQI